MLPDEIYEICKNLGLEKQDIENVFLTQDSKTNNDYPPSAGIYKAGDRYGTVSSGDFYKAGSRYGSISIKDF